MLLSDLLTKGYLPRELPPPFNSQTLGLLLTSALPAAWRANAKGELKLSGKLQRYDHRRVGYLRRKLAFPNPIFYYHLAYTISAAWPNLRRHLATTQWSTMRPTRKNVRGRAFRATHGQEAVTAVAAAVRQTSRYILVADVARFYPSIYTHSIPWALHGKASAKKDFSTLGSLGNQIDYWVRSGQDRQTVGIPIGPDTSWLIAELIMVSVETAFARRFGSRPSGYTIIDDVELGFQSLPEAERAMADLEGALNEFELSLNPKKIWIKPLPQPLGNIWTESLSVFKFRPGQHAQATDIVRYFNLAFAHAQQFPEDNVIKYAVSRLRGVRVNQKNWPILQSLLIQCMLNEPGSMSFVERQLRRQRSLGHTINRDVLSDALSALIIVEAPLGHSAEVAWAIWLAIVFNIELSFAATAAISNMLDSVVALTALHAYSLGLLPTLTTSQWENVQASDDLWDEHWLLAYEANVKGWLSSKGGGDHVAADPHFSVLKTRGIYFYDDTLVPIAAGQGYVQVGPHGYPLPW